MHLIKLCVGIENPAELIQWQAHRLKAFRRAGKPAELVHRTRQMPKRRLEVLDGGSLYWVIKGQIQLRQRILDLREETDAETRAVRYRLRPAPGADPPGAAPRLSGLALSRP